MAGWLDPFPESPVVLHDDGTGNPVPVPRAIAQRFGFAPAAPQVAASAPIVSNPAIGTPPPVEPVAPVSPTQRLAQEQAQSTARDLVAEPAPKGKATAPVAAPAQPITFEPERRGPVTAPDGTEIDAVSGGEMPAQAAQPEKKFASALGGGDYAPETTVGQDLGAGPQSQYELDQQAAHDRLKELESTNQALAINEANRKMAMDGLLADYGKLQKDLNGAIQKSADHKIDPRRKWHSMSTGSKIGAIIFAAIGGLGSALKHQGDRNPALDVIKAAIDQDLSLQFAERDKLGQDITNKRQQINDFQGLITNRQAQFLAERSSILESEARKYEQIAAKAADEGVKFQYQAIAEQMRAQAMADAEKAAQQDFENGIKFGETRAKIEKLDAETALLRKKAAGGGGGGAGTPAAMGAGVLSQDQYGALKPNDQKRYFRVPEHLGGGWAPARSEIDARNADAAMLKNDAVVNMSDEYLGNLAKSVPGFWGKLKNKKWQSGDIAIIRAHNEQFKTKLSAALGQGAISKDDAERFAKIIPDPATLDANSIGAIRNLRENTARDTQSLLYRYGIDADVDNIYGQPPSEPAETKAENVLAGGATVPRGKNGVDVDAQGQVLVPDEEAQRQQVATFVEQARREYIGSGTLTGDVGEKRFRQQITNGAGGLAETIREAGKLRAEIDRLNVQAAKAKGDKAKEAKEQARRATQAYSRMIARRDALQKEISASVGRENTKATERPGSKASEAKARASNAQVGKRRAGGLD